MLVKKKWQRNTKKNIFKALVNSPWYPLLTFWCSLCVSIPIHVFVLTLYVCRASLAAQLVKNLPARQETPFNPWVRKIPWRRDGLPTPVFMRFPGSSDGKESACNTGDPGLIPGFRRSPGGGHGNLLQCSCLENPMDRGAGGLQSVGSQKSETWLST